MRFNPNPLEEPEINLIPFIDVLLVILIFLMLTTTYSRYTTLRVNLPTASAQVEQEQPEQLVVSVASDGRYAVGGYEMELRSVDAIMDALRAQGAGENTLMVISADASAPVQAAVTVMDAARRLGLTRITFAAQTGAE